MNDFAVFCLFSFIRVIYAYTIDYSFTHLFADRIKEDAFGRTQPRLLSLNMTNNAVTAVENGAFLNMTRLVRLILTRNKLQSLFPDSFTGKNTFFTL